MTLTPDEVAADAPVLLRFGVAMHQAIDRVAGVEPLFMDASQKTQALLLLEAAEQRLHALKAKVLASARLGDDVCEAGGHRDVADLLSQLTHTDRPRWAAESRLAESLDKRWQATAAAWLRGDLTDGHARVIVRGLEALDELPEVYSHYCTPEVLRRAEDYLIAVAAEASPAALRKACDRLFEKVAPEAAEEIEAKKLAAMERRAVQAMSVTIKRDALGIEGLSEIRLRVPDAIADRFTTYLQAFTNPRVTDTGDGDAEPQPLVPFAHPDGERIPHHRRMAMAFGHFLECLDPRALPLHGGDATTVIVTIGLDQLRSELGAADLGLGEESRRISAGEARRLACTAAIIPAVLGGDSEVLDLGRARRLYSRPQRKAMALRDQCCRAEGCTVPATWCEAHHFTPWSMGGRTDLADGGLLCRWHHQRIHDDRYLHKLLPGGGIRFVRKC